MLPVQITFFTGLERRIFRQARLIGDWDAQGRASPAGSDARMTEIVADDGCPAFTAQVLLDPAGIGQTFRWSVRVDTVAVADVSGIAVEVNDPNAVDRVRSFQLRPAGGTPQIEAHWFTLARRLGACRISSTAPGGLPALRFSAWAPHARAVEAVWVDPLRGYVADDGTGIDPSRAPVPMAKGRGDIWRSQPLPDFDALVGRPYMYRVTNAQGRTVYRTDLFSRQQVGSGTFDPQGNAYAGDPALLDGTKSSSLVVPPGAGEASFWEDEFTPGLPVPSRVEDLVLYELHVAALGFGKGRPGTLEDAIALLPHLGDLGVNAVELMPMSEYAGVGWGYGDSHLFVIESTAGSREQYRRFVRECHRRGIAVIQDVVYNHFDASAARAEWAFDSDLPEENAWYWYEGKSRDYPSPDGGYLDNGSSGFSPNFAEETVRQYFVSSAAMFMEEYHVDGLRVDLTQAMHRDNVLHANGAPVGRANLFGAKLLREWSRTLRLIKPAAMLIAEDHTGWDKVTQLPEAGGLGFDATWYADFYHGLVGAAEASGGHARLLREAGYGDNRPLNLEAFATTLAASALGKVIYHSSHDEAGNDAGSMRTLPCAVNGAALVGATRQWAEARARLSFGIACLAPGTPMFFMAEEVGAQKPYRYDSFIQNREDMAGLRSGDGAKLFHFYQDMIRFRRRHPAARTRWVDVLHVEGTARVMAFRRSTGMDDLLVVANYANQSVGQYVIQAAPGRLPDGTWRELFNSDSALYGGANFGNGGADLPVAQGRMSLRLPASGLLVFAKL